MAKETALDKEKAELDVLEFDERKFERDMQSLLKSNVTELEGRRGEPKEKLKRKKPVRKAENRTF